MRIIGKDGQEYKSEKECLIADKAYDEKIAAEKLKTEKERKDLEAKVEQEKIAISKRKKELSNVIEKAEERYSLAEGLYEDARKKANSILKAAKEEANSIIQAAAKEVEAASSEKMKAVAEFNKEFGPYQTIVTGSKAISDYNRIVRTMSRIWDNFWNL